VRSRPTSTSRRAAARGIAALALALAGSPLHAQRLGGYALNVFLGAADGPFSTAGVQDFQRLRLMLKPARGVVSLDLAYEQTLTLATTSDLQVLGTALGQPAGGGDWLPLQGTIATADHATWRHRVDRLAATIAPPIGELVVGRQPVSWATTLFLTPADPFAPFDPADPFREYRAGVDAARVRVFPGAMTELEAVVRPATFDSVTTMTALARGRIAVGRIELAGWGGVLHDRAAGALAVTVTVAGAVLRSEAALRREHDTTVVRVAVGADRSFEIAGRTLYVLAEYQRDGFGAAGASGLPAVLASAPYRRGELQVLGRDEVMTQTTYQVHPLVRIEALALWNAGDGSALIAPALGYDALANLGLRVGGFIGIGAGRSASGLPGSEYGTVPVAGYLSGSLYF
jgi:hypothetical protein